jgi:hypothetical protein
MRLSGGLLFEELIMSGEVTQETDERTEQRGVAFERALQAGPLRGLPDVRYVDQYGTGTAFSVLPGGLAVGGPNLKSTPLQAGAILLRGAIRFLPDEELHLGVYIRNSVPKLAAWLSEIVQRATSGDKRYSDTNNNAKFFLVLESGTVFVRNKGFWKSLIAFSQGPSGHNRWA